MNAADTNAEHYAYLVLVLLVEVKSRVLDRLVSRDDGVLLIEVHLVRFLAIEVVKGLVVLDLAGEVRLKLGRVKVRNLGGAANSLLGVLPCFGSSITKGSYRSHTGNDNSF